MAQNESAFHIKAVDKEWALRAIKALLEKESSFCWVDSARAKRSHNLCDAMREWNWDLSEDNAGNIVDIAFAGEKAGDDLTLFKAIAPFVEDGSYIEMRGEDGEQWRWVFIEKTCLEKTPKVSWE